MDFLSIAKARQSCRGYDSERAVEDTKLQSILDAALLAPSACNGQPYHITVCKGDIAKQVAKATQGVGINKFATEAPILLVISEEPYVKSAALGAKLKGNDYRSIDIGILAAYITAQSTAEGLGSCILGWFNDEDIRKICDISRPVRLVITLGYPKDETLRPKKRKSCSELVSSAE